MAHLGPSWQIGVKAWFYSIKGSIHRCIHKFLCNRTQQGAIWHQLRYSFYWLRIERENIALRRLCTIIAISRQNKAVLFSKNHNTSTIQDFEQFGTLIILNPGDKYPYRPGFKPSTSQFRAITGPNRPSVPIRSATRHYFIMFNSILFYL